MKNLFTWVIGFACCVSSVQAQQAPYKNPLVPTEMRVNDLLQRMLRLDTCILGMFLKGNN